MNIINYAYVVIKIHNQNNYDKFKAIKFNFIDQIYFITERLAVNLNEISINKITSLFTTATR